VYPSSVAKTTAAAEKRIDVRRESAASTRNRAPKVQTLSRPASAYQDAENGSTRCAGQNIVAATATNRLLELAIGASDQSSAATVRSQRMSAGSRSQATEALGQSASQP
jgi:hypothetical protein